MKKKKKHVRYALVAFCCGCFFFIFITFFSVSPLWAILCECNQMKYGQKKKWLIFKWYMTRAISMTKKKEEEKIWKRRLFMCWQRLCAYGNRDTANQEFGHKVERQLFCHRYTHALEVENKSDSTLNWHLLKIALPRKLDWPHSRGRINEFYRNFSMTIRLFRTDYSLFLIWWMILQFFLCCWIKCKLMCQANALKKSQ